MKLMARVIHHLFLQRKHGLNAENLTRAQCFPHFVQFSTLVGLNKTNKILVWQNVELQNFNTDI